MNEYVKLFIETEFLKRASADKYEAEGSMETAMLKKAAASLHDEVAQKLASRLGEIQEQLESEDSDDTFTCPHCGEEI